MAAHYTSGLRDCFYREQYNRGEWCKLDLGICGIIDNNTLDKKIILIFKYYIK